MVLGLIANFFFVLGSVSYTFMLVNFPSFMSFIFSDVIPGLCLIVMLIGHSVGNVAAPTQKPDLHFLLTILFFILAATFSFFQLYSLALTVWGIFSSKGATESLLFAGRLLFLFPLTFMFFNLWVPTFRTHFATPVTRKFVESARGSLWTALVDRDDPNIILMEEAYKEMANTVTEDRNSLIDRRRFLFDKVHLLAVEQAIIMARFSRVALEARPHEFCPVCQLGFVIGQTLSRVTCSHEFHNRCLLSSITKRVRCPACKVSYRESLLRAVSSKKRSGDSGSVQIKTSES